MAATAQQLGQRVRARAGLASSRSINHAAGLIAARRPSRAPALLLAGPRPEVEIDSPPPGRWLSRARAPLCSPINSNNCAPLALCATRNSLLGHRLRAEQTSAPNVTLTPIDARAQCATLAPPVSAPALAAKPLAGQLGAGSSAHLGRSRFGRARSLSLFVGGQRKHNGLSPRLASSPDEGKNRRAKARKRKRRQEGKNNRACL